MLTSEEVTLKLLILDGLNYASWSTRAIGPYIKWIVDVSISPPSWSIVDGPYVSNLIIK